MRHKMHASTVFLTFFFIFLMASAHSPVFANAAEPPAIVIIAADAPSDLVVRIYFDSKSQFVEGSKTTNAIETQFKFFWRDIPEKGNYIFEVRYGDERYEIALDKPMQSYHATYTLNLKDKKLIKGETLTRNLILVGLRVGSTVLIEGVIFWFFAFREKRTWILFLLMNLLTQGVLNLLLATNPVYASYVILSLIFGEFFVFIVEWIIILTLVKEHSRAWRFSTVTLANLASLILGGYLISILPI